MYKLFSTAQRPAFRRAVEMHGLNLDQVLKQVQNRDEFMRGDRNFCSYRLDIVLRVIHEHFKRTKEEDDLKTTMLKPIFDNLAEMLRGNKWKSTQLGHLAFLAFACQYDNPEMYELISTKIRSPKPGQVYEASTIRNYLTVMAYGKHPFSEESWMAMTQHLISLLQSNP